MSDGYPLAMLINLRERRYQGALADEKHKKQLLQLAAQELESKKQELSDYLAYREEEIERRYQEILDSVKTQEEIAAFNSGLGLLYEKESVLKAEIAELNQKMQAARRALDKAREQVVVAHKAVQKLESHREIWLAEQRRLLEYKADLEMEDFRVKKPEY